MAIIQDLRPITPRSNGTRSINTIDNIARHHSATTSGDWEHFWSFWQSKGWGTGGYHEIILRDGTVQICYDPNEITNGIAGHNSNTYHICVVGNGSFTEIQEKVWEERVLLAIESFGLSIKDVKGHKEFSGASTACPGIDMNNVRNRLFGLLAKGSDELNYLKRGDKGEAVKTMQRQLLEVGLKLEIDGSYGPATENAIRAFQTANNLKVDGYYGPATFAKLKELVKSKNEPKGGKLYKVQVGAFGEKENADRLAKELNGKGYSVYIVEE